MVSKHNIIKVADLIDSITRS
ncbi:hypothetical protein Golob_011675 [Gossypium lobatum]|uniref:Uncharacterized protein n=1 Tax=Gossypium lobatum TaxID=34289 RepID=A0A7J8MQQ2_9ROSI|nr:hypothetical protein [Gossypium lobatum]